MINWQYYPKSDIASTELRELINVFVDCQATIDSEQFNLSSNEVLAVLTPGLQMLGFEVETGKKAIEKVRVPVLFGRNGDPELTFEADAAKLESHIILEVEAGRGVTNYQFLKDLFEACMMRNIHFAGIAVRNLYRRRNDFEVVARFFDTLYASGRLQLPLNGILIVGY